MVHSLLQLVYLYNLDRGLLPSRRMFGLLGAPKKEHLRDMQAKLETMLMTAVQNFQVPPKELLKFVHYSFTDVLSVTQALAAFFYSQGEVVLLKDKAVQISPLQLHCITKRMTLPLASSESGKMTDDFGHLLDFLHHLKKLKIAPPTDDPNLVKGADQLTFDLSLLRSLEVLLIESLELHQFQNRSNLPEQLVAMEVRRSITSLKEILLVYPPAVEEMLSAGAALHHVDLDKALCWKHLKKANFKLNNIKAVDKTLSLAPYLEKLDLSYNCIEEIENLVELPHLTVADLSHNKISSLASLHTKIGNITKLGLASNNLKSLDGMQKALSLQFVDLSNNSITETSEVGHMSRLPCLEELSLTGNPIAHSPSYRSNVFSWLPNTATQVALDGKKASKDELEICASIQSPTTGHKRVSSRTPDIKPDNEDWDNIETTEELAAGLSVTSQLEEMRREGGDRWLALLNAEKTTPLPDDQEEELVSARTPKQKKRKGRKHHRHHHTHRTHKKDTENKSRESSPEHCLEQSVEAEEEPVMTVYLQGLVEAKTFNPVGSTVNFEVTLLEYEGSFDVLSVRDVDQLLLNQSLEECTISIDSSLNRVLEVVVSASKTRCQRDLALLQTLKVHEGRRLAVSLQFLPYKGTPHWVVYCVPDPDALARLYVTLQHAMKRKAELELYSEAVSPKEVVSSMDGGSLQNTSTQQTAALGARERDRGIDIADIAAQNASSDDTQPYSDGVLTAVGVDVHKFPSKKSSASSTPVGSRSPVHFSSPSPLSQSPTGPATPLREQSPVVQDLRRSRSPVELDHSQSLVESDRSQSPVRPTALVRLRSHAISVTPQAQSSEPDAVRTLAAVPPVPLGSRPGNKPILRKIIKKPGLESVDFSNFFEGVIAKEQHEILMNVLWGGCNLNSCPSCEIEVGLIVSDKAVYLLEVLNPDLHRRRHLSWESQSMPLASIFHSALVTLSKITIGIFDQTILAEFISKGNSKSFVVFPRTYEQMVAFTENLKAALDASGLPHEVTSTRDALLSSEDVADSVLFLNPDASNLQKLKESLVCPKALAQVSNYLTVTSKAQSVSFAEEVHAISEDFAEKFEIMQYVIVGEICCDVLPIANGCPYLTSRGLVLTTGAIFLCKEEIVSWPSDNSGSIQPPFSRCLVLDSQSLSNLVSITICDKALPVVSYTDPVYEFAICFATKDEGVRFVNSHQWKLCVHDRQYIDQLFSSLRDRWLDLHQKELRVEHVTTSISSAISSAPERASIERSLSLPAKDDRKGRPGFFKSDALTKFASNTNYQRQKYFKKHVAEAEFMKLDETLLSVFLSHCSPSSQDFVEIETCVLASNYAIYLLSDVENIRMWLERNGPSSFSRMSLLSTKDSSNARCFYRLWLNDIKEVQVGLFYLAVKITASSECIVIHTNSATTTLSFLSALSCNLNLRDSAEEEVLSDLLSDYIDLAAESIAQKSMKGKKSSKSAVEYLQHTNTGEEKLKKLLIGISPTILRNSSIEECVASMQFLCQQVMLLVEEMRIRNSMKTQALPHLVLLTNYGLYVCRHSNREVSSPSVFDPSELQPKKWCHIDLIDQVVVTDPQSSPHALHTITIHIKSRSSAPSASSDSSMLCLLAQNSEQSSYFLYMLSLFANVRSSKQLRIQRVY